MVVYKSIGNIKFVKSVELVPKKYSGVEDLVEARDSLEGVANLLTAPENPRGLPGIDPVSALYIASRGTSLTVMPHITPRDKNSLYMYSQVLTALKLGINHFFVIGGDPIHESMTSKAVMELDVMGLIKTLSDPSGYMKDGESRREIINIGAALNPYRDVEQQIVAKKLESGARFFVSQAIYDSHWLTTDWIKKRNFRLIAGFIPIRKKSQVEFAEGLHIHISDGVKERLLNADDIVSESRKIILEAVDDLKGYIDGIHIMPMGHNKLAREILESI